MMLTLLMPPVHHLRHWITRKSIGLYPALQYTSVPCSPFVGPLIQIRVYCPCNLMKTPGWSKDPGPALGGLRPLSPNPRLSFQWAWMMELSMGCSHPSMSFVTTLAHCISQQMHFRHTE